MPKDYESLSAGEQALRQIRHEDEFEGSIAWKGATALSHIRLEFGQYGRLPGSLKESGKNAVYSANPFSTFSRFCSLETIHDRYLSGQMAE